MTTAPGGLRRGPGQSHPSRRWRRDAPLEVRTAGDDQTPRAPHLGPRTPSGASVSGDSPERSTGDAHERPVPEAGLVLVVDDNASFRGLAARILAGWGYEVIEAGSIPEALACAEERRPRTVLVDIGLPDGDGFALTQQLVALPSSPRVVLVSTDADAGNRLAAHRVGAIGFLPKDELLGDALRGMLDG
jgi:CheY-like chemotaxis protein